MEDLVLISKQQLEDLVFEKIKQALEEFEPKVIQFQEPKEILNIDEAAALLQISKRTLYNYTSRKQIPHLKVGKFVQFQRQQILDWLKNHKVSCKNEEE